MPRPRIKAYLTAAALFCLELLFGVVLRTIGGHNESNAWMMGVIFGAAACPFNTYLFHMVIDAEPHS